MSTSSSASSSSRPLALGLIGLGRHGSRYARHLVGDVTTARLVAVGRAHPERELPFTAPPDLVVHEDPVNVIRDPRVQAVIAVTPPVLYPHFGRIAADCRKPLLVEKPLAPTAELGGAMLAAMLEASTLLMVAHTLRFDRALQTYRERVASLGRLRRLSMTLIVPTRERIPGNPGWLGRGPLLDLGVHLLDLVPWLTGSAITRVSCRITPKDPGLVEELADIDLELESGCQVTLRVGWQGTQRTGMALAEGDAGQEQVDWNSRILESRSSQGAVTQQSVPRTATLLDVIGAFVAAIQTGTAPPVVAAEALTALRWVDACYESAKAGRPIEA